MDFYALVGVFGFFAGILLYSFISFGTIGTFFFFVAALSLLLLYVLRRVRVYLAAFIFLVAFSLGAIRTDLVPQHLPQAFVPFIGTEVMLEGTVVADPDVREDNERITVEIEKGTVRTKILAVTDGNPSISYGDTVSVQGLFVLPDPFSTDGGRVFAYDKYLAKDGVFALLQHATISVTGRKMGLVENTLRFLYGIKHSFIAALNTALSGSEAGLAAGILVGGKQGLGKTLLDAFTITGLLQIVVLSGYNVMIVAQWIQKLFSFLPKRYSLFTAGGAVGVFVVAAGAGSSGIRAGVMALIALFAKSSLKTYDALRALFFALILMFIWNPLLLAFDVGLQFSVAATLGLILLSPFIETRLSWIKSAFLRDVVATTVAAQLFVLPILLYQTGNLSLVSLFANILTMPVIPAAMLFSFIGALAAFIVPVAAPVIAFPAHLLLAYVISVAKLGASLPFAHVIIPAFPFWIVLILYMLLWYVLRKMRITQTKTP